jgi:hypothetical protein
LRCGEKLRALRARRGAFEPLIGDDFDQAKTPPLRKSSREHGFQNERAARGFSSEQIFHESERGEKKSCDAFWFVRSKIFGLFLAATCGPC